MSMVVPNSTPQQNPLSQLLAKFDGVEKGFKAWLAKQSLPVEAAVVSTAHAAQGSAFGVVAGTLINNSSSLMDFQAPVLPLVLARSIGLMAGVNAGISCVMKRLRRKEDTPSRMAAGFCSGFVFGYVINLVDCLDPTATAIMGGIWHALFQGLAIQLEQDFALRVVADLDYSRTRSILRSIGMRKYEYNFRRGLLTDSTLPLLTDRQADVLKDVGVPPGPRLLILDRIKRDTAERGEQGVLG